MIISDNAALFKLVRTVIDDQWRKITLHEDVVAYVPFRQCNQVAIYYGVSRGLL